MHFKWLTTKKYIYDIIKQLLPLCVNLAKRILSVCARVCLCLCAVHRLSSIMYFVHANNIDMASLVSVRLYMVFCVSFAQSVYRLGIRKQKFIQKLCMDTWFVWFPLLEYAIQYLMYSYI